MTEEMFTLRQAQERMEQIADEIASVLGVVASDLDDMRIDDGDTLEALFHDRPQGHSSAVRTTSDLAKMFARHLVLRINADGPLGFTWTEEPEEVAPDGR